VGTTDGRDDGGSARDDSFTVSPDDLVVLARVASKAKVARDSLDDRDDKIAEAVTGHRIEVAAVAHAAGLSPAEVAEIVFTQESKPSPFTGLRRAARSDQAS
jgi:hypothetical protein